MQRTAGEAFIFFFLLLGPPPLIFTFGTDPINMIATGRLCDETSPKYEDIGI
jgi:hypothetical protein